MQRTDKITARNERRRRTFERAMKRVEATLFLPDTHRSEF